MACGQIQQGFMTSGMRFAVTLQSSNSGPLNVRYGSKASFRVPEPMSAFTPKATVSLVAIAVAFGVTTDIGRSAQNVAFDP